MDLDTPSAKAFRRAIDISGSAEQLAQAIGASVADIEAYAAGLVRPPASAFIKAIDVIATGGSVSRSST